MSKGGKLFSVVSLALIATMALTSCSLFNRGSEAKVGVDDVSFFLVMWSPSGTLEHSGGKGQEYFLTLESAAPTATFLSDRPKRLTGQVPLPLLAESWGKMGLEDTPPLAAIVVNEGTAEETSMTGELSDPQWDAQTGRITFTLRPSNYPAGTAAAFTQSNEDSILPEAFGQTTLLIDPSSYAGVEYLVTAAGVVALRETYANTGKHPIDVLPPITYMGPDYFGEDTIVAPPALNVRAR